MSRFIPTRRNNPCPICGDIRGNCRQVDQNMLCRGFSGCDAGITGWRYLYPDKKQGVWGVYVPSDYIPARRDDREKKIQAINLKKMQEAKDRSAWIEGGLSNVERDRGYRALISQLTLDDDHWENLQHRGLTGEMIVSGGFRTITRNQPVRGLPGKLPGISDDGSRVIVGDRGILIPIVNKAGLIVGMQVRIDGAIHSKYRWMWSRQSSHLTNGELPLAYVSPEYQIVRSTVGLCEGFLKSFIAANLSGHAFIGASGGNFISSPKCLATILEHMGMARLVLYPDAGAVSNPHVMLQYMRLGDYLTLAGYEVMVAWWNQINKGDLDVDELLASDGHDRISLISFRELVKIERELKVGVESIELERYR